MQMKQNTNTNYSRKVMVLVFFANLFRLDDFMNLQLWVKIDELNHLLSHVKEHAVEEVEEHSKVKFYTS